MTKHAKLQKVETLTSQKDKLTADIAKLGEEIAELTTAIADIDKAVAEATIAVFCDLGRWVRGGLAFLGCIGADFCN